MRGITVSPGYNRLTARDSGPNRYTINWCVRKAVEDRRTPSTALNWGNKPVRTIEKHNLRRRRTAVRIRTAFVFRGAAMSERLHRDECFTARGPNAPRFKGVSTAHALRIGESVLSCGSGAEADRCRLPIWCRSQRMSELFPPGQASCGYVDMSPERVRGAPQGNEANRGLTVRSGADRQSS